MRAESLHPSLGRLGPDLLDPDFDADEALRRLRDPSRAGLTIGEALLDQRALAGIGNIWKNETLWTERVSPFAPVGALDDETAGASGRDRAQAPARASGRARHARRPRAPGSRNVYGRTGRPCPRCRTPIASAQQGTDIPRTTYWCPTCQPTPVATLAPVSAT